MMVFLKLHFTNSFNFKLRFSSLTVTFLIVMMILQMQVSAQESSNYVMYRNGIHSYNPGASGMFHKHKTSINGKYFPNTSLGDDVKSVSVFVDQQVPVLKGGIGFSYTYDIWDDSRYNHNLGFSYAYHFDLGSAGKLGAGINLGLITCKFKRLFWTFDGGPFLYDTTTIKIVFTPGLAYKFKNFDLGISIGLRNRDSFVLEKNMYFFNSPAINIFTSYKIYTGPKFSLTPGVYAVFYPRTDSDRYRNEKMTTNYNFNLTANFSEQFWIGAAYNRNFDWGHMSQSFFTYPDGFFVSSGIDIKEKYGIGLSLMPKIFKQDHYNNDSFRKALFYYAEFVISYKLKPEN